MRYILRLLCVMVVLAGVGLRHLGVYAQVRATPALDIIDVDSTQLPTVQLSLVGGNLPDDIDTLPLKLFEGDQAQVIVADTVERRGLQVAIVVDPRDILALGRSGQTHQAEVIGATLDLIERQVITRNVDLLAAYSDHANGELQTIHEWTGEPNLIFNSLVRNEIEDPGVAERSSDLVFQALDTFSTPGQPSQLARSLILFSSGATSFDMEAVVAKANELKVRIHTIELVGPGQETSQANALQQLAQRTNGHFVFLASTQELAPLAVSLAGLRNQRILTYQTNNATLAPIKVSLALPDGSSVEATFEPTNDVNAAGSEVVGIEAVNAEPDQNSSAEPSPAAPPAPTSSTALAAQPESVAPSGTPAAGLLAPVTQTGGDAVTPPAGFDLPRGALPLALTLLILLVAYFVYREVHARGGRMAQSNRLNRRMDAKDSRLFALSSPDEELKPLPKNKAKTGHFELQADEEMQAYAAEPWQSPQSYAGRDAEREGSLDRGDAGPDDEATAVPWPGLDDDDATYRLAEAIEQPVIGYFVRVTNDPNLPNELPIYGLSPARGELRQIHIGRHSKNNTVVINDKNISREHAVIVQKEGRLYLRDNASTAGTFLNWKQLRPGEELLLRHNDIVSFGEIVYEFHAKGEDEATVVGE